MVMKKFALVLHGWEGGLLFEGQLLMLIGHLMRDMIGNRKQRELRGVEVREVSEVFVL